MLLGIQSASTPWWAPLGAAAVTGAVALLVLHLTNRAAAQRLEYEREMKIRDDRRKAYAAMARVTKIIEATPPGPEKEVAEAHAELELLTENDSIINIAGELVRATGAARQVAWELKQSEVENPFQTPQYQMAKARVERERDSFIRLAKDDLGYEPKRSWWRRFFGFE